MNDDFVGFINSFDSLWQESLKNLKHDFYHLSEYNLLEAERLGGRAEAFIYRKGKKIFFICYCAKDFDVTSVYGYPSPLLSEEALKDLKFIEEAIDTMLVLFNKNGICAAFFRFHPLLKTDYNIWRKKGNLVSHGNTVFINLEQSQKELWKITKKRHRSEINKLKRNKLITLSNNFLHLDQFIDIYYKTMKKVGASKEYYFKKDFFYKLKKILDDKLYLYSVICDNEMICASLFSKVGEISQYYLSATNLKYSFMAPNKYLLHEVTKKLKETGSKQLNLGGGLGGENDALYQFKSGFSSDVSQFYTWRKIINEEKYSFMCEKVIKENMLEDKNYKDTSSFFPFYSKPIN